MMNIVKFAILMLVMCAIRNTSAATFPIEKVEQDATGVKIFFADNVTAGAQVGAQRYLIYKGEVADRSQDASTGVGRRAYLPLAFGETMTISFDVHFGCTYRAVRDEARTGIQVNCTTALPSRPIQESSEFIVALDAAPSSAAQYPLNLADWAGSYSNQSDGYTLSLSKHGAVALTHVCMRGDDAVDLVTLHGALKVRGELLEARFNNVSKAMYCGFPKAFYPIQWGNRHYLASGEDLTGLVNKINAGKNAGVPGWIRDGDDNTPLPTMPLVLPSAYQGLLLEVPLKGKVVAVKEIGRSRHNVMPDGPDEEEARFVVRIDRGSRDGVFVGMTLWLASTHDAMVVTKVSGDHAEASYLLRLPLETQPSSDASPKAGWEFSSRDRASTR